MAQTYDDYINGQNFVPPQIAPQFTMSQKIGAAGVLGAQESMFLSGSHAASNLFEGYMAKERGEETLTRESFEGTFPEEFEFRDGEYLEQAKNRFNYTKNRNVSEIVASQMNVAGNFIFGMAGGTLVDAPFMLMPGGAALQTAKTTERALRTGTSFKKAQALVRMADTQSKLPTLRAAFLGATAEQAVEANVVLTTSEYTGRDYGSLDAFMDLALGPIIATGMNVPLVAQARRVARQQGRMAADVRAMESYFTSGDYTEGTNLLRKYSDDLDLVAKADPAVESALNTPKDQRTPADQALVQDFLDTYISDIEVAQAKAEVEVDPNKPIAQARGDAEAEIQGKVDALKEKVAARAERKERSRGALGFDPEPTDPANIPTIKEVNKAAETMDADMKRANEKSAERVVDTEKKRAEKVETRAKETVTAQETISKVVPAQVASFISTAKEDTGADGVETYTTQRDTIISDLKVPESQVPLYQNFMDLAVGLQNRVAALEADKVNWFVKGVPEKFMRNKGTFADYNFFKHQVDIGNMSNAEATDALMSSVKDSAENTTLRAAHDLNILVKQDHLEGKSPQHVLKYLKTLLDGRPRRGVAIKQASVENKILAQIQEDQGAISKALISNGLYDLFMGVSTVGADVKTNPDAQRIYGAKLKESSDLFWRDLTNAARTQTIPDSWKGIPALEEVFSSFIATNENLRLQLNAMGAGVRYREGFTGLSQRWDERSILRHGEAQWRADMRDDVDWEATRDAHGDLMNVETDDAGQVTDSQPFDREAFLDSWYAEITSNETKDHPSMDIVQSFGKHRTVILKEGAEIDVAQKYSGHKSMGLLYMDQIRHRSEMIAVAQNLGTRPIPNFEALAQRHGVDPEVSFKDVGSAKDLSTTLNTKHLMATVEYLTGALDNPANKTLSRYSKAFRQVSNLIFLPLSGVSAISDIPMIALTLQQNGMLPMHDMSKFMTAYTSAHARRLGGDEATRQVLEANGAGLDATLNAASARVALADPTDPNILGKLNDAFFTLNYLNGITTSGQEAFMDIVTRSLADQLSAKKLDPLTVKMLEDFGFTTADMKQLAASVEVDPDGVSRVGPPSIKNKAVSRKTREMFLQLMNEAVMFPDAGTQALVRGGLQAGTVAGEAARDAFQYTSFPLGMTRIITRKFMTNYQGTSPWTTHQTGTVQMTAFVGSMLAMGYLATAIKDVLRGREPMNLTNMSGKGWGRVVAQSGISGILEPLLAVGTGDVRGALAPLPTTLVSAALKETGAEKVDALRPLYGSTYPIAGPAVAKIIGWAFAEALPELQKRQINRAKFLDNMYQQPK